METKKMIKKSLEDLIKVDDIQACFVMGKLLGTIAPDTKAKLKNIALWTVIMNSTHKFFPIIEDFYVYGLSRLYYELKDYEIIIYFISPGTALLAIIPSLVNRGLVEVEIENTTLEIRKALGVK